MYNNAKINTMKKLVFRITSCEKLQIQVKVAEEKKGQLENVSFDKG